MTLSMVEIYNEAVRSGPQTVPPPRPGPQLLAPPPRTPNRALPFFARDLLAPGPPQRLAVRQGPAGEGGIQVAGLTHWDVPNLESLHQVRLLGGAAQSSEPPPCTPTWAADAAAGQPCPPSSRC